jgi:hypothetical protein
MIAETGNLTSTVGNVKQCNLQVLIQFEMLFALHFSAETRLGGKLARTAGNGFSSKSIEMVLELSNHLQLKTVRNGLGDVGSRFPVTALKGGANEIKLDHYQSLSIWPAKPSNWGVRVRPGRVATKADNRNIKEVGV